MLEIETILFGIGILLLAVYFFSLLQIFMFALAQLNLMFNYLRYKKKKSDVPKLDFSDHESIPFVTIQLPVYNEMYVMERLLNTIVKLEYPKDKIEFQVLDDSTDESLALTSTHIKRLQKEGHPIEHIVRENRTGFKAGALKEGMKVAKGEFFAIFDADFLPESDWLLRTIPYFKDEQVGVVQTRWGHINRDYSLLTQIQAFALDAHFYLRTGGA